MSTSSYHVILSHTLKIIQRRFRKLFNEFSAEKFAPKQFSLHESSIFIHSNLIRSKLYPFWNKICVGVRDGSKRRQLKIITLVINIILIIIMKSHYTSGLFTWAQVPYLLCRLNIKSNKRLVFVERRKPDYPRAKKKTENLNTKQRNLEWNFHALVEGKDSHHVATIKTSQAVYSTMLRQKWWKKHNWPAKESAEISLLELMAV